MPNPQGEFFVKVLDDFVSTVLEAVDPTVAVKGDEDRYLKGVQDFPNIDELLPGGSTNYVEALKRITLYEFAQVKLSNKLSELMIKRTQARVFVHKLTQTINPAHCKDITDRINFYLARITELEAIISIRVGLIDKCIVALRSLKLEARH
jgi:hypothetical protein